MTGIYSKRALNDRIRMLEETANDLLCSAEEALDNYNDCDDEDPERSEFLKVYTETIGAVSSVRNAIIHLEEIYRKEFGG